VVDAEESRSGIELEEDVNESDEDGVDVVDVATIGVDDVVEILDEEDCVRSVSVEEDVVLEAESDVVEEEVTSEDVAAVAGEDEGIVKSDEEGVDGVDDSWSRDGEVVASNEIVDVTDEDELAVWAEEK